MERLKITCLCGEEMHPYYASANAAGADLKADVTTEVSIEPGEYAAIPTGIKLAIPVGFEGQVRPRSGLAMKHGVTVLNSPGTIDADYRGEVKVLLINYGKTPFRINRGDRIAQLIIAPVERAEFVMSNSLEGSERGSGGFGSTG